MPIRFPCQQCGTQLSIARRKVGASIDCPKCGHAQIVPPEDAADSAALTREDDDSRGDATETIILAEGPSGADASVVTPRAGFVDEASEVAARDRAAVEAETGRSFDRVEAEMVLVSRQTIYLQGTLIAVVGMVGLLAGYLIGRGGTPGDGAGDARATDVEQVVVEGRLLYRPADRIEGDEKAVAIFLPHGMKPAGRIETAGIRPEDAPTPDYSSLRKIRELGGTYVAADAGGEFLVNLPKPGVYHVLLISSKTRRPDNAAISEIDLATLDSYLRRPEYLIGSRKYRLTAESLSGLARIEYDFGLDRR
ncbi:MAG: hypothetical protein GX621_00375 [Pirellulaceae bacterium]|nr:hypothetical protein [Pirellulaceae bacterium]